MLGLTLVIPAYNESLRLPRSLLLLKEALDLGAFSPLTLSEILIIDDGSKDHTAEQTEELFRTTYSNLPQARVIRNSFNRGKGHAVRTGLLAATQEWCLISDADTATPWNQIQPLYRVATETQSSVAIGSRDVPGSNILTRQSWIREHMGKTFNFLVRMITGLPFMDTQCGFKLVRIKDAKPWLHELSVDRFAWDVEFLMLAKKHGLKISEVPVTWAHQDSSSVHPIKDSLEMLFRILQIRWRLVFHSK